MLALAIMCVWKRVCSGGLLRRRRERTRVSLMINMCRIIKAFPHNKAINDEHYFYSVSVCVEGLRRIIPHECCSKLLVFSLLEHTSYNDKQNWYGKLYSVSKWYMKVIDCVCVSAVGTETYVTDFTLITLLSEARGIWRTDISNDPSDKTRML